MGDYFFLWWELVRGTIVLGGHYHGAAVAHTRRHLSQGAIVAFRFWCFFGFLFVSR